MRIKIIILTIILSLFAGVSYANYNVVDFSVKSEFDCKIVNCDVKYEGGIFREEVEKVINKKHTLFYNWKTGYYWSSGDKVFDDGEYHKKVVKKGKLTSYGKKILKNYVEPRKSYRCVEYPAYILIQTFDGVVRNSCKGFLHFHYVKSQNYPYHKKLYFHFHGNDEIIYGKSIKEYQKEFGDIKYIFNDYEMKSIYKFIKRFTHYDGIQLVHFFSQVHPFSNSNNSNYKSLYLNILDSILENKIIFEDDYMSRFVYGRGYDNKWYRMLYHSQKDYNKPDLQPQLVTDSKIISKFDFVSDVLMINAKIREI